MSAFNILPESQQKSSIFCKIVFTILVAAKGSTGFGQSIDDYIKNQKTLETFLPNRESGTGHCLPQCPVFPAFLVFVFEDNVFYIVKEYTDTLLQALCRNTGTPRIRFPGKYRYFFCRNLPKAPLLW